MSAASGNSIFDRAVSSEVLSDAAATLLVRTISKTVLGRSVAASTLGVESEGAPVIAPVAGIQFPSVKEALGAYGSALVYDAFLEPYFASMYTPDQYVAQMAAKGFVFAISDEIIGMMLSGTRLSLSPNKLLRSTLMHSLGLYVSAQMKQRGFLGPSLSAEVQANAYGHPLSEIQM